MAASRSSIERGERGFVLITALWLLILCGAVAALLLARSLAAARTAAAEAAALGDEFVLDGAIETVAADLVINGERSRFATAPSEHVVTIDGREVRVEIEAESGKVDLNEARLELVDRVLGRLGWEAEARARFVAVLAARRSARQPLTSLAEIEHLVSRGGRDASGMCAGSYFTVFSGRAEPDAALADTELARLLGVAAAAGPRPLPPGMAIRLEVEPPSGATAHAVLRISGLLDQPLVVSSWSGVYCARRLRSNGRNPMTSVDHTEMQLRNDLNQGHL